MKSFLSTRNAEVASRSERQDAAKKAPGDAHGEAPMLEVADSLVMRMLSEDSHFAVLPVEFREVWKTARS
jgi:hypothetical protein